MNFIWLEVHLDSMKVQLVNSVVNCFKEAFTEELRQPFGEVLHVENESLEDYFCEQQSEKRKGEKGKYHQLMELEEVMSKNYGDWWYK